MSRSSMQRGAAEANAESDRLAQARRIGEACGTLAAALNRCMTEDDVRRILREELPHKPSPPTSPKQQQSDTARLDAFDQHPGWELSLDHDPDCGPDTLWRVHVCNGGRNDREWTLLGAGATAREAIDAALNSIPSQPMEPQP